MPIVINHDPASRFCQVGIEFTADDLSKPGLVVGVITHHLLGQAIVMLRAAADAALHGRPEEHAAEAEKQKARIDSELAAKLEAASVTSDVVAVPK